MNPYSTHHQHDADDPDTRAYHPLSPSLSPTAPPSPPTPAHHQPHRPGNHVGASSFVLICQCLTPALDVNSTTGCSTYYTVQYDVHLEFLMSVCLLRRARNAFSRSGDTCSVMETQYGITFDQIRQWNPEVDANCTSPNRLRIGRCRLSRI